MTRHKKIILDIAAFIACSSMDNGITKTRTAADQLATIAHDVHGIANRDRCFMPRVSNYAKFSGRLPAEPIKITIQPTAKDGGEPIIGTGDTHGEAIASLLEVVTAFTGEKDTDTIATVLRTLADALETGESATYSDFSCPKNYFTLTISTPISLPT